MTMRKTIVIVDDDRAATDTFASMLDAHGYDVRVASEAQSGWPEIDRGPSAILLDLHLPDTDGITMLRRIRSTPLLADTPVALMTGDYLIDDRVNDEIDSLSAVLYFKPLWEEDLVQIVRRLLSTPIARTSRSAV